MAEKETDQPQDQPETTPEETQEETPEQAPEGGQREVGVKEKIEETLNRKFASDEEALKAVAEMKKLVGDQKVAQDREKAKQYDELKQDPQMKQIFNELDSLKFSQRHPEVSSFLNEDDFLALRSVAERKGQTLAEAYENSKYKEWVESQQKAKEEKEKTIESVPDSSASPNRPSDEEMQEAVREFNDNRNPGPLLRKRLPHLFGQ